MKWKWTLRAGFPPYDVVGLPDTAILESRERVQATAENGGLMFPRQRLTVNLAPAGNVAQARSKTLAYGASCEISCPSCLTRYRTALPNVAASRWRTATGF